MAVEVETASELAVALVHVFKKITALRNHKPIDSEGIESAAYPLLMALQCGPSRVSALANQVHSDTSTVSRQVGHLVAKNMVEKIADPADGRAQQVQLTEHGRDLVSTLIERRAAWMQLVLKDWDSKEVLAFAGHLTKFDQSLAAELARLNDTTKGKEQS